MMRIVFVSEASFELTNAASAYDATRAGLGRAFIDHIDQALMRVVTFPDMAAPVGRPFRRVVLHRFPFSIVYRVQGSQIHILGVLPTRADPERLQSRLTGVAS